MSTGKLVALTLLTPVFMVVVAEVVIERTILDVPEPEQLVWSNIRRLGIKEGFS